MNALIPGFWSIKSSEFVNLRLKLRRLQRQVDTMRSLTLTVTPTDDCCMYMRSAGDLFYRSSRCRMFELLCNKLVDDFLVIYRNAGTEDITAHPLGLRAANDDLNNASKQERNSEWK